MSDAPTDALTVIGHVRTRTVRVLWLLEELGLPYAHNPARPGSDEARGYNPSGKVPILLVGDLALTDSTAILTWLADRAGRFTYPAGTLERARQDGLTLLILDEIEALIWMSARHSFVLPEEMRLPAIKDSLKWEFARNQARLAVRLGDAPFLMGDQMTVPDILLTQCLAWAATANFPETEPNLTAYRERLRARPAYLRAAAH
jgi:glutathione S-transferase